MSLPDLLVAVVPVLMPSFGAVVLMGLFVATAVWLGHTDRSREEIRILRSVIGGYIDETGSRWNEKVFAAAIGISAHQLSRIWAGREALNFLRLAELPDDFKKKWAKAQAEARGARLYERDEVELWRGVGRAEMLKMTLPTPALRKEA